LLLVMRLFTAHTAASAAQPGGQANTPTQKQSGRQTEKARRLVSQALTHADKT
jgi:hypothetical protein